VFRARTILASAAICLVLTGCGDDAEDDEKGRAASSSDACEQTEVTATYPDGTEVDLDRSVAVNLGEGAAYTIYAADYAVENLDTLTGATPGESDNLATLAITTFNAEGTPEQVEEGARIEWTDEFGVLTFSVVLNQGATASGNTAGASGTVDVVSVDEATICVDVDYSDDEKSLVGTIVADVV